MFFLFLSIDLVQVTADTWWYLRNLLSWLSSPTLPSLDAFCSRKSFPFHFVWDTWGNWSGWKSLFFHQQLKFNLNLWSWLTPHLSMWVLSCKKKRGGQCRVGHSQGWRAVGMDMLVSPSHLGQQRFAVDNMRLFCELLICTSIWGRFFICSRWAVMVSYLPSWVFLSFISNQTISALLAKLYIVSHSYFLQTQYPPWPVLAGFHLHCCVYSFYKLLFQH